MEKSQKFDLSAFSQEALSYFYDPKKISKNIDLFKNYLSDTLSKKFNFDLNLNDETSVPNEKCKYCGTSVSKKSLTRHLSACEENPENIILPCGFCKEYFSLRELESHTSKCELNPATYKVDCEVCEVPIEMSQYENHLLICKEFPTVKPVTCYVCKMQVAFGDYGRHILKVCQGGQDINCKICTQNIKMSEYESHKVKCQKENEDRDKECTICLEELAPLQEIIFLQCLHRYHRKCIENWSQREKSCPICLTKFDNLHQNP